MIFGIVEITPIERVVTVWPRRIEPPKQRNEATIIGVVGVTSIGRIVRPAG